MFCSNVLAAALAWFTFFGLPFAHDGKPKLDREKNVTANAPLLQRVAIRHLGSFDDSAKMEITQEAEHFEYFPRVGAPYDQEKVDDITKFLKDRWNERGIAVGVRTTLTALCGRPRYAALEVEIYKQ